MSNYNYIYILVTEAIQFGSDTTDALHAYYCAVMQAAIDRRSDGDDPWSIEVRPQRGDECAGLYQNGRRLRTDADAEYESATDILNEAYEIAAKAYRPGNNSASHRCGQCALELIGKTVDCDLRDTSNVQETLEAIASQNPLALGDRMLGDGHEDPTVYEWLTEHADVIDRDMWKHAADCDLHVK